MSPQPAFEPLLGGLSHCREADVDVSVSITSRHGDEVAENLEASVSEDNYSPDLADDALRLHRELHPSDAPS